MSTTSHQSKVKTCGQHCNSLQLCMCLSLILALLLHPIWLNYFSVFFREKPKREKRPSKFAWNKWERSRRRRRKWGDSIIHIILTFCKFLRFIFHLYSLKIDMFCHCTVAVALYCRFLSILLSLHNESIRLWFWWSLPVSEACEVWVKRRTVILEEWNFLITLWPVPVNVTLHTHSFCCT